MVAVVARAAPLMVGAVAVQGVAAPVVPPRPAVVESVPAVAVAEAPVAAEVWALLLEAAAQEAAFEVPASPHQPWAQTCLCSMHS